MTRFTTNRARAMRAFGAAAATVVLAACAASDAAEVSTTTTRFGEAVGLGNGTVRTYVTMEDGRATEVGVALSEGALEGLPSAHHGGGEVVHGSHTFASVLALPADNPTPFDHVLFNWNPGGHEPPGLYDMPHFDAHFYMIGEEERRAIDPADPAYQAKAERTPHEAYVPAGYVLPEPLAFPAMGVHWVDPASPELNGEVFTKTMIYGSWDGALIFAEPMVTKAWLETRQDFSAPLPQPRAWRRPGLYPTAYRIHWDEAAREYRIALTGLTARN